MTSVAVLSTGSGCGKYQFEEYFKLAILNSIVCGSGPLLNAFYDGNYSLDDLPSGGAVTSSQAASGYILNQNLILGTLRLQQVSLHTAE